MKTLTQRLKAVQRRMLLNRFLSTGLFALGVGWAVAALLILADRLVYLSLPLAWVPWAATTASLAAAALSAFLARPSLRAAAVHADGRLALAERLSSALLVTGDSPMEQAVREDARRVLPRLGNGAACPVALSRNRAWRAGAALLFLALALASPEWDLFGRRASRTSRAQALLRVQTAGTALEQRVQKYQEEAKARGIEKGEIGKNLEQLAAELKEGIQDPKAALADVNDLQARLKAEMDQFKEKDKAALARDLQRALRTQAAEQGKAPPGAQADALKDLMNDVRELSKKAEAGTATPKDLAEMQKALSSLAEALGKTEATRQLAEELSRAAEALDQKPGAMPQISDDLKKLADQLGQMDRALDKEQMMEMAKADLEELKRQLGGQAQDPWQAEVTPEDQQAFEQRQQELAQADPQKQPGGT